MELSIRTTWDGDAFDHKPVTFTLNPTEQGLSIKVTAPFFDDPGKPDGPPGEAFDQLWDYEVAEIFFLNEDNKYVELEFCPHGQHLVLLLENERKMFKHKLPLHYTASISDDKSSWRGEVLIPWELFPPDVTKVNAFAIHGSGDNRVYEALYPVPKEKYPSPDFHKLKYFQPMEESLAKSLHRFIPSASLQWTGHL